MLDWHVGLPAWGPPLCWRPVQMEGRDRQCQLVSRIKTTHLFTEVWCKATGPAQGDSERAEEGWDGAFEREIETFLRRTLPSTQRNPSLFLTPGWLAKFLCLLLIFLKLPEAITAVDGRRTAGWHRLACG